jgi:hypothetical protein
LGISKKLKVNQSEPAVFFEMVGGGSIGKHSSSPSHAGRIPFSVFTTGSPNFAQQFAAIVDHRLTRRYPMAAAVAQRLQTAGPHNE